MAFLILSLDKTWGRELPNYSRYEEPKIITSLFLLYNDILPLPHERRFDMVKINNISKLLLQKLLNI